MPSRQPDQLSADRAPVRAGEACETSGALIGVGVDAEQIRRFETLASGGRRWRHVYSPREAEHLAAQPQAAVAFCAAFCAKEAVCKALGAAYPFRECECLVLPGDAGRELVLSPELRERHRLSGGRVLFREGLAPDRGECVVEAHLFGVPGARAAESDPSSRGEPAGRGTVQSRIGTVGIAAVASARPRLEQEHFCAAEIAELGGRRAQSLAGSLALKRALVALWDEVVRGDVHVEARDFEIGHLRSGAPRLVAAPPGPAPARVSVSIAHTREWAYGLAAID